MRMRLVFQTAWANEMNPIAASDPRAAGGVGTSTKRKTASAASTPIAAYRPAALSPSDRAAANAAPTTPPMLITAPSMPRSTVEPPRERTTTGSIAASGHWSEGRSRLRRALGGGGVGEGSVASVASHSEPRARALYYAAELAYAQGDLAQARALYEGSVSTWRALGDRRGLARALHRLGEVLWSYGDSAGVRAANDEAAALFREVGDAVGLASALRGRAKAAILTGDHALARSLLEQSVPLSRAERDEWGVALALLELSRVALLVSDPARAITAAEGGLSRFEMLGDTKGVIVTLHHLGLAAGLMGEHERARSTHERALAMCAEVGDARFLPRSLTSLANVARAQGHGERAARLLGAADVLTAVMSPSVRPSERTESEIAMASVRAELGEGRFAAVFAEGRAMSPDEAVEYALSGDES